MNLFKGMHYSLTMFPYLELVYGIPLFGYPLSLSVIRVFPFLYFFLGHSCSLGYETTLIYYSLSPFLQFLRSPIFMEICNSFAILEFVQTNNPPSILLGHTLLP